MAYLVKCMVKGIGLVVFILDICPARPGGLTCYDKKESGHTADSGRTGG